MSNGKFALTFQGISDVDQFFQVLNSCREPVYLTLPNGKIYDLRNNAEIQTLMKWIAPEDGIGRVQVQSSCSEDAGRLLHYMATGKISA